MNKTLEPTYDNSYIQNDISYDIVKDGGETGFF